MELEQYVLDNYINKLVIVENGKKTILEKDLSELKFNVSEMNFIKNILNKNGISIVEEQIQRNNRSKLVRDYSYGQIAEINYEPSDVPVLAKIEYDNYGNLIYENWEKLECFLEDEFIPENIRMKRKLDKEIGKSVIFPSIQLNRILKLRFSEIEVKYIVEYLNKNNICVGGMNSTLDGEFQNYDYVNNYKGGKLQEVVSPELTIAKFKRYSETKSKELREELILENMRLASYLAYKMSVTTGIDMYELQSYAYEGLIKAVDGFDPNFGCNFSTYAYSTIRGYILKGIPEIQGLKKGAFYYDFLLIKRVVEEELETTIEKSPEIVDEIIELLVATGKIKKSSAREYKTKILLYFQDNLDKYMDNKEISPYDSEEYMCNDYYDECLSQDNVLNLEINNICAREQIYKSFENLSDREITVLKERCGFEDGDNKTLEQIACLLHCTRERIRQVEAKGLRKLRHPENSIYLRGFMEDYSQYNYEPNMIKINPTK